MISNGPMVFVGGLTLDAIAAVHRYPAADERVVAETVLRSGGGPAATAAVAAARLGCPDVHFVGAVGADAVAERLLDELGAEGIDVGGCVRVEGAATGSGVIVVDTRAGTRAICARPGPPLTLDDDAADRVHSARRVHVDHLGWNAVLSAMHGVPPGLSVDVSYPPAGFVPAGVDLFVPSLESLAARYAGRSGPAELLRCALAEGARRVVATRGADGCVALTADGGLIEAGGVRATIVSTLGAGDVFHGALLAGLDRGDPLPEAMVFANQIAAASCRGLDGRSAIPHRIELPVESPLGR